GEFMVLVGPSGCGKSTLLRILAGLEEASDGSVAIGERDVTDLAPRHRDIAMVFQAYALYPHMTVRQNLGYGLKVRRTPKDEVKRRVDEVATLLGLTELLERRPAQLSGGQRQRVAMGRAIAREPKAFLMDEPLSNLDAKLRVGMRASLAQLHEQLGVTTVYVTHDQVEAMTLGQRVAVMRDGHLLQVDSPQRLYQSPRDLFVAAFIGSPAMNLVEAALDGDAIVFGHYRVPLAPERPCSGRAPPQHPPPSPSKRPSRDQAERGSRARARPDRAARGRRRDSVGATAEHGPRYVAPDRARRARRARAGGLPRAPPRRGHLRQRAEDRAGADDDVLHRRHAAARAQARKPHPRAWRRQRRRGAREAGPH